MTIVGIASLLDGAVAEHGDRPALVHGEETVTYRELDERCDALADRIAARVGETHGGRIAVVAPNSPALVSGCFAALRLGAVPVPLSARLRGRELEGILADAEPLAVLTVASHLGYDLVELLQTLGRALPSLRATFVVTAAGEIVHELRNPAAETPAALAPGIGAILYTSGTTGVPKGVLVTHDRERSAGPYLADVLRLSPADASVFVVPISHAFGLTCYLATVASGGAAVLVDSTSTPAPLHAALDGHPGCVLHGSPSVFATVGKSRSHGLATVRTGFVAGASPPAGLLERLDRTGVRILNLYGLTETGAVTCCRPEDPPPIRATTAGRPLPGFELRIRDGELQIAGSALTPGYHRRPDETASALEDGWLRTGDLARIEDGFLTIAGRAKDVVHVGGFNVFPAEVEGALLEHPDVAQAVVVGTADERMGEVLQAFVVARPGAETTPIALLRHLRGRIAGYKLPYRIHVLPELPLLASGKPDRRALAAQAVDSS